MRFSQSIVVAAIAATTVAVTADAAMARGTISMFAPAPASQNYSGAYPVTISHSQFSNGTGCLTLTSNGSGGLASLVFHSQRYSGSFLVLDDILMATLTEPLYGQNGAVLFVAHASRGLIGHGIYENAEGGSDFDAGDLAFGTKGGC
jgi:hypothetical protein